MTNRERTLETLEANSHGLCDECISKVSGISLHQTVQQLCSHLAKEGLSSRRKGACSRCGKSVLVNKLAVAQRETEGPPPLLTPTGSGSEGTQPWFDEMPTTLVRMLNQLDPSGRGEPFRRG